MAQSQVISEKQFQALARKLRSLQENSISASVDVKLETYWSYGDLIVQQDLLEDAGYHNSILRDLARETGITLRTLQRSVAFRKSYTKPPTGAGLSWTHIRLLAALPTKKQREFYAGLTRERNWTSKELQKAISSDLYSGGKSTKPQLKRPREPSYLYAIKDARVIDGDTLEVLVDLGFHSFALQRVRLAQIDAPESQTPKGRAARNFLVTALADANTLVIQTRKSDLHGRYVASVFASPRKVDIDTCFHQGIFINDVLLQKGHARFIG